MAGERVFASGLVMNVIESGEWGIGKNEKLKVINDPYRAEP